MAEKLLIEILAEREGRGHAELRRMAYLGVLKDQDGNPVSVEDLSYAPKTQADEGAEWIGKVEASWDAYQKSVQKLRGLLDMEDSQEAEWDHTQRLQDRIADTKMRLANIQVNPDQDWNERCIDKAHELCMDLSHYQEEVQRLISIEEDEDSGSEDAA